jgi:hypothetical protein
MASVRFQCDIGNCTCSYSKKASLKDHQVKKHTDVFEKNGIQMKRVAVAANPSVEVKRLKTDNVDLGPTPPIIVPTLDASPPLQYETDQVRIERLEAIVMRLGEQQERMNGEISQFQDDVKKAFEAAGKNAAVYVKPLLEELSSEVFAHVTDLRQQMALMSKKNMRWCVVCFERENDYAFMPCRHKCVCKQCAQSVAQSYKKCPICRASITGAQMIYDITAWDNEGQ